MSSSGRPDEMELTSRHSLNLSSTPPLTSGSSPAMPSPQPLSLAQTISLVLPIAGINFVTSFTSGLIGIGLPTIAAALELPPNLLLWPVSIYALTNGSTLILAGSIADIIGSRPMFLVGSGLINVFITASGLSRSGQELLAFRALQGVSASLAIPTGMSIISTEVERGRRRNMAFSVLGLAQPMGYSVGLVLGGVFIDGVGWRAGFFVCAGVGLAMTGLAFWRLKGHPAHIIGATVWTRLLHDVDWIGAVLLCSSLSLSSYVLVTLGASLGNIKSAGNIAMLLIGLALLPIFGAWMHRQEKLQKPALIPNSLWRKGAFTSVCVMIVLTYAVIFGLENYSSLYFQKVQGFSALEASIRLLPAVLVGIAVNFLTGYFIANVKVSTTLTLTTAVAAISPLLMAVNNPKWPYWYDQFFAQALSPIAIDTLFTIGILIVSDVFPTRTQALAGAVFNTLAQFGTSLGLTLMSLISDSVIDESSITDKASPAALVLGYRATFWAQMAWMAVACVIGAVGFRKTGFIGTKHD